jgi:hypothetical protein
VGRDLTWSHFHTRFARDGDRFVAATIESLDTSPSHEKISAHVASPDRKWIFDCGVEVSG